LEFAGFLRSSGDMHKALVVAARIFGLDSSAVDALRTPSRQSLGKALVKLDLCMMMWQRFCWKKGFACAASMSADSSTQSHWDFYCQRRDVLRIRPDAVARERLDESANLSSQFSHELSPLACIGFGEGSGAHKMRTTLHVAQLLTGSHESLLSWRWSIRGICSDQGAEKELCDSPNIERSEDVVEILSKHARGELPLLGREPETLFFQLPYG
jgi:hypothetical protein